MIQTVRDPPAIRETQIVPGSERALGDGTSSPLQEFCLETPTDRGFWYIAVLGITNSRTQLSDFDFQTFKSVYVLQSSCPQTRPPSAWAVGPHGHGVALGMALSPLCLWHRPWSHLARGSEKPLVTILLDFIYTAHLIPTHQGQPAFPPETALEHRPFSHLDELSQGLQRGFLSIYWVQIKVKPSQQLLFNHSSHLESKVLCRDLHGATELSQSHHEH